MAPTPEELASEPKELPRVDGTPDELPANRVVISGMSGIYPQMHHIKDLSEALYNKVDIFEEPRPRWVFDNPEVPQYVGVIPDLDRFDAQFFKVHYHLCCSMDTMARKVLEQAYQAIYDAGVNAEHLSGKKIGVFIGSCLSETEKATFYVSTNRNGFGIAGCNKSMFANRISYWLNAKGPSQAIDAACCSSTVALEQAYLAMTRGDCEAAIVGGSNVCLHPQTSFHYGRTIPLCKDGKTKSYDQCADGCVRSEAINVLFLQKASDAVRIYADVVHVKNTFVHIETIETGQKYGFCREINVMEDFLRDFYEEAKVSPSEVEYVEGFGSGDGEADRNELEAYDKFFCNNRKLPLPVGSVLSNIGYCEAASGITAVTKVLLGFHKGEVAGNLHYTTPRDDVSGLREGRIQVITDNKPIQRTYIGINGLSITGVNSHILLHGHYKPKDLTKFECNIPRLVMLTARQDSAVKNLINDLKSRPIDPEELALLQNIHSSKISGHLGRGYVILDTDKDNKTVSVSEKADYFDGSDRPLWFVYSGMGSQWAGMGAQLMRIPVFAAAIERCRKVLEPKGIDIVHIITSPDKTIFDNILHSFVGIAAIQIGLTDILHAVGLVPDKIIGHSVGELGCAYADGCLTAEEMILSAYSRGLVSIQTPFIRGSMAAVGIGFTEVSKMCPPEIEVACHNGPDSSTISGPADVMTEFVAQLTAKGIFAKEVPCSNIAYHSRYIAEAGPGLLKYLSEVIVTPKLRSDKWVSTSVPQDKWPEESAKYSSAEYHTNNLLSPVLFEETSRLVPNTAVLVEVAPHGLLQAILKRSLPASCAHVPLTRRGHQDNARFLLEAIGKIYMEGYYPDVRPLYPKVEFPVSTGTPHLSHLVEWAHNETWLLPLYAGAKRKSTATCTFILSVHDPEHNYLQGNIIQGQLRYPFAGALVAAWDTLAMTLGAARRQLSAQFRDVQLFAQPALHDSRQLRLTISLHRGTGLFEISDDNSKVATGYIIGEKPQYREDLQPQKETGDIILSTKEVYQILSERNYTYGGEFQSIYDTNGSLTEGRLRWTGNWVTLLDGALQLNALRQPHDGVSQPAYIRKISLNTNVESTIITEVDGQQLIKIEICPSKNHTRCGGIELEGVRFRNVPSSDEEKFELKTLQFVPRFSNRTDLSVTYILQVFMQIIRENVNRNDINIAEVDTQEETSAFGNIQQIDHLVPDITVHYNKLRKSDMMHKVVKESDVICIKDFSIDEKLCKSLYELLKQNTYIISAEDLNDDLKRVHPKELYNIVASHVAGGRRFELAQWRPRAAAAVSAFSVRADSDLALLTTARANLPPRHKIMVLASYPPAPGLKELVKQWRQDSERNQVHVLMFKDKKSEELYMDQLPHLDLAFNVVSHGELGGEYFVPLSEQPQVKNDLALTISRPGDFESLQWVECIKTSSSGVPVQVHFAGLNAYDVMKANGEVAFDKGTDNNEDYYGMDFSGTIKSGQRVMGLVHGGAMSDRVQAQPELLWPVPEHWSLEDAATVPLPYAQAYYCLAVKYQLMPGMSILVSGGAGALGQAIISIALHLECRVLVVVSDILKKRFLLKLFPKLKADYVLTTRDHSFVDKVLTITSGQGCDVVICGRGESKNGYLKCSSSHGVTLDCDQVKRNNNFMFGMSYLSFERSYAHVDFSSIFRNNDIKVMKELQNLIAEGIIGGAVRPLSRVSFAPDEAARAFRLLAASRHRGRVLLRLQPTLPPPAQPRISYSPDHCQLLVCDDEGLMISLVDKLVKSGAKKLHLHSTTASARFNLALESWQKRNVKVTTSTEDLTDKKNVMNLLHACLRMGPVEGVFVATTYSNHALVENLNTATKKLCPTHKFFAVMGKQSLHEEEICSSRAKDGFPAMMLSFPDNVKVNEESRIVTPVKYRAMINAVERGLRSGKPVLRALDSTVKERTSILQHIITTANVSITKDTLETTTLQDLGITGDGAHALSVLLKVKEDIVIDKDQIPFLTIQRIREMDESLKESDFSPKEGLDAIFSYVDPDELLATCEIVSMLTHNSSNKKRDDEFDSSQTFLCILPGLEGHHGRFRLMCERLKLTAFVLQPGLDHPDESINDMTERFAKTYLKKIGHKPFYLLGYEMGVFTALKMAAILEDKGLSGTVFCLGGGPEEWLAELEAQLRSAGGSSEQALQDAVARHMVALMGGGGCEQLEAALRDAPCWRQKVQASVRALRGRVAHSAQYARALIEAAYVRVAQARRHAREQAQAAPRALRSRVVLLRCPGAPGAAPHPLQRYSRQPLAVHRLRAPPSRAPDDLRVAAVINQYLDDEILKEFDSKNLCHTYLLNPLDFAGKSQKPCKSEKA